MGERCELAGIEYDSEWAEQIETDFEVYMTGLVNSIYDGDEGEVKETVSGQPFCGCETCFSRESLAFLIPRILEGHLDGQVQLKTSLSVVKES